MIGLDTSPYSGASTASRRVSPREAMIVASQSTLPSVFSLLGFIQSAGNDFSIRSQVKLVSVNQYQFNTADVRQLGGGMSFNGTISGDQLSFNFNGTELVCQIKNIQVLSADEVVTPDDDCRQLSPQIISGSMNCMTRSSAMGRKAATDDAGNLYVTFKCDEGLHTSSLPKGSSTWMTAVNLGVTFTSEYAIQGGPAGVVYVTYTDANGAAYFLRSINMGVTWTSPRLLMTPSNPADISVSIGSDGDNVYVLSVNGNQLTLSTNKNRGEGNWNETIIQQKPESYDVIVDKSNHRVFVGTSLFGADLQLYEISNGLTRGPDLTPGGKAFYSEWAIGNGVAYVADAATYFALPSVVRILIGQESLASTFGGLSSNDIHGRAISADSFGHAYVVSTNFTAVNLDVMDSNGSIRLLKSTSIAASDAAVVALTCGKGALIAYSTGDGQVYAEVVTLN